MRRNGPWLAIGTALLESLLLCLARVPPLRAVYESLAMFLLNGDSSLWAGLEDPARAIHPAHLALAWSLRFLAPVLAGSAAIDLAARLASDTPRVPSRWHRHVIVVGAGRLGAYIAQHLRSRHRVVVIEKDPDATNVAWLRERGIRVVIGDARHLDMLERVGIRRARGLVAATGSDLANLSAGLLALGRAADPQFMARVHVSDPRLVEARITDALPAAARAGFSTFCTHDEAARALFASEAWGPILPGTLVVIAGHGRFGRAVLRQLLLHPDADNAAVLIVDQDPNTLTGCPDRIERLACDVLSPDLEHRIAAHAGEVRCLVCTDNDGTNIVFALDLRARLLARDVRTVLFTRMFEWPEELLEGGGALSDIRPISVVHLAECALGARVADWFSDAPRPRASA